jgi:protein-tyrosine phosphatase
MTETKLSVPSNTYWVVPGAFLAGSHPALVDDRVEERLSALLAAGIRTFIDLTEQHETDGYAVVLQCLAEERGMEVAYFHFPICDHSVPSAWTMGRILDVIDRVVADGRPMFVHCFGGIGRTGTAVGCHLRRRGGATRLDVMARIAELRQDMPIALEVSPHAPEQVLMVENLGVKRRNSALCRCLCYTVVRAAVRG